MNYTFNGTAKTITIPSGGVTLDLVDLHSRWKEWVLAGNAPSLVAFRAIGGDIPAIPLYLFLLNGWRIIPQASNHTLTVTNGVLEVDGGGDPFVDPAGTYKIRINRQTPGIAIGYSTTGGTEGATPAEIWAYGTRELTQDIAALVLAAAQVTPIHSDMRKAVGQPYHGDGSEGNKLRSTLVP